MKTSFGNVAITVLVVMAGILIFSVNQSQAAPHLPSFYQSQYESQNPEYILQTLARLRQALIAEDDLENFETNMKNDWDDDDEFLMNQLCQKWKSSNMRSKKWDFGMQRAHSAIASSKQKMAWESANDKGKR
ncbi:uncharacterized protein [Onthophagus taurus]|uniref:uncharacterized protein n=1 Tax=Onthophagus taurus TaxID=166361 RepID=UPI0039BDD6EE